MKEQQITTRYIVARYEDLTDRQRLLVDKARQATYTSYSPYSHFKVGAAIALSNGEIVTGSNQENVAYPSGTCAERTTAFYAHAQFPDASFEAIAIAARGTDDRWLSHPISPCGACRQVLLEYELLAKHDVEVLLAGDETVYILPAVKSLLPFAFEEIE